MIKLSIISTSLGDRLNEFAALVDSVCSMNNYKKGCIEFIFFDQTNGLYNSILSKIDAKHLVYIDGTRCSLSHARNCCIARATGDYICFADDDAVYDKELLTELDACFRKYGEKIFISNVLDLKTSKGFGGRKYPNKDVPFSIKDIYSLGLSLSQFIPRALVISEQFDERLGAGAPLGGSEETDLLLRLNEKCDVVFCNGLIVKHPHEIVSVYSPSKYHNYAIGYGYILMKYRKKDKVFFICHVVNMFLKSIAAMLFRFNRRGLYWARITGLAKGISLYVKEKYYL